MMRSSSPIRNQDGSSRQSGRSPDGSVSASCVAGRCVAAIRAACGAGTSAQKMFVEAVLDDVQIGCAVAARNRPRGLLVQRAAGEHRGQLEAVLAGIRCEAVHVDEPGDLAGVAGTFEITAPP